MQVIDRLADYGVSSFEVFGGDALLRKDAIFELIRRCSQREIATYFPTNANLCDRETVGKLVKAGLGTVYISIDDIGDNHDQVRGTPGTFVKVRDALDSFSELRGQREFPRIVICTTLSSMNFRNFPRLVQFLEQYPVNAVYPRSLGEFSLDNIAASAIDGLFPEPYFATSDGQSHLMSRNELIEMKSMIRYMKKRTNKVYINWPDEQTMSDESLLYGVYPQKICRIATTVATLNPNGDVVPCPFFSAYVLGNVSKLDMQEIWGNERHREFIRAQADGRLAICRNCNSRPYYPSLFESFQHYLQHFRERIQRALA